MSLKYLYNNIFRYQEVPNDSVIYKASPSGFEIIKQEQGVLMSDINNKLSFGIPTAAELVENYTGNSIIMTSSNKLVEVPVTGTSPNKLLRLIDGSWQIVDFNIEYIKPELYDPSSWQLWIADDEINVINIPKEDIANNIYGVQYNETTNSFNVYSPDSYKKFVNEDYIQYKSSDSFKYVYQHAKFNTSIDSNDFNIYTCIYSSNVNEIFDGQISDHINLINMFDTNTFNIINKTFIFGGLYIKNVNPYTSTISCIIQMTDGENSYVTTNQTLRHINNMIINNDNTIITPVQFSTNKMSFNNFPQVNILFQKSSDDDPTEIYWYYPKNYINIYVMKG